MMEMSVHPIPVSRKIKDIITQIQKKGHNSVTIRPVLTSKYMAHKYVMGIMWSKFHLDAMKTVGGV